MSQLHLTTTLYRVASNLADDLNGDLRKRAANAIDATFQGQDLRALTIQFVIDTARSLARSRVAEVEKRTTVSASEEHKRAARMDHPKEQGHIGKYKPGSASRYNQCDYCQYCQETKVQERAFEQRRYEMHREIHEKYTAELKSELFVQWTEELLSAEIAMPDGSRTTWGLATVEQHQLRYDMLTRNSMANMENAARHLTAIEALAANGVPNLVALVGHGQGGEVP